jgi:iron complex transport system substrate-binding protein
MEKMNSGDKIKEPGVHARVLRALWVVIAALVIPAAGETTPGVPYSLGERHAIVDQAGRRIEVKRPFRRIISLYGAHTENLYALGCDEAVIGVGRNEAYPPAALKKPEFSYQEDPEKFLAARPDLVLVRPMIDRGYPDLMRRLEKSGITVVSIQPATVEEMLAYWKILGVLTGREAAATGMIARFREAVGRFEDLTAGIAPKKRVYFESIHSKMKTFTPESMAVFALETAGGINIAADARQVRTTNIAEYGKERILARATRIEVYLAQYGAMNRPSRAAIKAEPGFTVIRAIRDDEVYLIDEMIVSRPTMRLLAGVYAIGRVLYPARFDQKALEILAAAGVEPGGSADVREGEL